MRNDLTEELNKMTSTTAELITELNNKFANCGWTYEQNVVQEMFTCSRNKFTMTQDFINAFRKAVSKYHDIRWKIEDKWLVARFLAEIKDEHKSWVYTQKRMFEKMDFSTTLYDILYTLKNEL